jgi:hypothetical protein
MTDSAVTISALETVEWSFAQDMIDVDDDELLMRFMKMVHKDYDPEVDDLVCPQCRDMNIDRNMEELFHLLNEMPGVMTHSSCGGHDKEPEFSQAANNEWWISFSTKGRDGQKSLQKIRQVAKEQGLSLVHDREYGWTLASHKDWNKQHEDKKLEPIAVADALNN